MPCRLMGEGSVPRTALCDPAWSTSADTFDLPRFSGPDVAGVSRFMTCSGKLCRIPVDASQLLYAIARSMPWLRPGAGSRPAVNHTDDLEIANLTC